MRSVVDDLPVEEIGRRFHNLIPSRFPTIDPYARIRGGTVIDFATAEELTNPRLREKKRISGGLAGVDQSDPRLVNWNHAPFAYPNPVGSWFFGADRNVLELYDDLQTAVAVAIKKRQTFLGSTGEKATSIEMRQLVRNVKGSFIDARGIDLRDAEVRRGIGLDAVRRELDGILYNPQDRPSATALVALGAQLLGKPDQGDHFKFLWDGQEVTSVYSFAFDEEFNPEDLGAKPDMLKPLMDGQKKRLRLAIG